MLQFQKKLRDITLWLHWRISRCPWETPFLTQVHSTRYAWNRSTLVQESWITVVQEIPLHVSICTNDHLSDMCGPLKSNNQKLIQRTKGEPMYQLLPGIHHLLGIDIHFHHFKYKNFIGSFNRIRARGRIAFGPGAEKL